MNKFEKKIAQMEQKQLYKRFNVWAFPQSDFGESVLGGEAGIYLNYDIYYDDPTESEEERIENAKSIAREALAYQYREFFKHPNVDRKFKIGLLNYGKDTNRQMKEGLDYELQVTEEEIVVSRIPTFDDIKSL